MNCIWRLHYFNNFISFLLQDCVLHVPQIVWERIKWHHHIHWRHFLFSCICRSWFRSCLFLMMRRSCRVLLRYLLPEPSISIWEWCISSCLIGRVKHHRSGHRHILRSYHWSIWGECSCLATRDITCKLHVTPIRIELLHHLESSLRWSWLHFSIRVVFSSNSGYLLFKWFICRAW